MPGSDLKGIDKSIIDIFDKTPEGIICPSFYTLKWANGCSYSCAWCYLQGTFRYPQYEKHGSHPNPVVKDRARVENALLKFLARAAEQPGQNFLLNSGELSDSLITSGPYTLPELIAGIEVWPENVKVLFLTKSAVWLEYILNSPARVKDRIIMSWSLNAYDVADRWEKGAPPPSNRMAAAKRWNDYGFTVRFRIDPIVPIENWRHKYFTMIDDLFKFFSTDEIDRITLGTLRGLQSTINAASEVSWLAYLDEKTGWGLKMSEDRRATVYAEIITYLNNEYGYNHVALCKETKELHEKLTYRNAFMGGLECNCAGW